MHGIIEKNHRTAVFVYVCTYKLNVIYKFDKPIVDIVDPRM